MARVGNHGIIVPRNRELLWRMYWEDEMSLPQMADVFGVTHKSVERAMRELGIPRRPRRTKGQGRKHCINCGGPVQKVTHRGNGALYGRHCAKCRKEHRNKLAREYTASRPDVRAKRAAFMREWSVYGNRHPVEDRQWWRKSKYLLRTARRVLTSGSLYPAVSTQPSAASERDETSQHSCQL